jgi:Raf kinase inhibitor-like YbhB/YbcL family protein
LLVGACGLVLAGAATGAASFALSSPAFAQGGSIPVRFTCDGANVSPALRWTAPPPGTRGFAILMDDPDAPSGTFTHWLGWDIPARQRGFRIGQHAPTEGTNDASSIGYIGPCPPSGRHRYIFKLYALRSPLRLAAGATRAEFLAALKGKSRGLARILGTYER